MLDEVIATQLQRVERFAWQPDDGARSAPPAPNVGSVHLWFEGGRGVHLDGGSDWTLRWSVSEPGDDRWLRQYDYDLHGRWVRRDATGEEPFVGLVGLYLASVEPLFDGSDDVVGVSLRFGETDLLLSLREGEIVTSPGR